MSDLSFYEAALGEIKDKNLYREAHVYEPSENSLCHFKGQSLVNFSSNSYLGLHQHPEMISASEFGSSFGTSAAASRLVSGTMGLHEELEDKIKSWKQVEAAMLLNSGFQGNCGLIQALADRDTVIFADRLVHASIIDGIRLSGASFQRFKHNDMSSLKKLLTKFSSAKRKMIISETIFSMDGDKAPIFDLVEIAKFNNAFLYLDDAHGTGVYGESGRGAAADFMGDIDLLMGTFSKALGSFGAYALMKKSLKEYLLNSCRSYIFSTALPPSILAANLKAIELLQTAELDQKRKLLFESCSYVREILKRKDYDIVEADGPIIALVLGKEEAALNKAKELKQNGFLIPAIRPPTVPVGTARLRLTLSALHSKEQIQALLASL